MVRVCFILGNLTAKSEVARLQLYFTCKAMDTLLALMQTYFNLEVRFSVTIEVVKVNNLILHLSFWSC